MNAPKHTFTLLYLLLCSDISSHERVGSGHKTYSEFINIPPIFRAKFSQNHNDQWYYRKFLRVKFSWQASCAVWTHSLVASSPGHSQILFHSCGMKKNQEKAWYQYYATDWKWQTRFRNDGNMPMQYVASRGLYKQSGLPRNSFELCKY